MRCERSLCVFNYRRECSNRQMARLGKLMAGSTPAYLALVAVHCDACQEIDPADTLDDCQGQECSL